MIEKIGIAIKQFFTSEWLEHHLLYFAIALFFISLVTWIIINIKEIRKLDKKKRKIEKDILRLLAKFKNKL